jgi:YVTN family beta-propeller protein
MKRSIFPTSLFKGSLLLLAIAVLVIAGLGLRAMDLQNPTAPDTIKGVPTRSTSIDINKKGKILVNVNTDANSVTVFRVEGDDLVKLKEIPVGREPNSVAIKSKGNLAYVTNSGSGTVSVVNLGQLEVVAEIAVGTEPKGCALTPKGEKLFVANFTSGDVSVIDTNSDTVVNTVPVGGNPYAVAITDNGGNDDLQTVFVSQFFAEPVPGGPGEGFDDGRQGAVFAFNANTYAVTKITLAPMLNSGFTADRTALCPPPIGNAINDTFCPDPNAPPGDPVITQDPQGAFPNQLHTLLLRGNRLFVPSIGAAPEPPVRFNTNVQALVSVIDAAGLAEVPALQVNLNAQITTEPDPGDPTTLQKLFGNDIVAMDASKDGTNFFIVSRGGNYVLRATAADENTPLNINAPNTVRIQTGNIPTGIVINKDGTRAYVNNEVNMSVSILDLTNNTTIALDVPSSTPPEPGSHAHAVEVGKLVFFTALGVDENALVGAPIRSIEPRQFRGKQSSNAWSTCASCHPLGLADSVTWIFPDGPRQTIPLDGLYSKINGAHDTRINNWSAARDSITDFNNNSRNVQCGTGFAGGATNPAAGCPPFGSGTPNPNVFDHGISQGASQALDFETEWGSTVRALNQPQPADVSAGRAVFAANCTTCHGGAKWTKSQVIYLNNPSVVNSIARDPGINLQGTQMVDYIDATVDANTLKFLEDVGTFDAANPIEIRQNGQTPFGALGFNVPSLLGVASNAPYFHIGSAFTLDAVFTAHALNGGTIATVLTPQEQTDLKIFLNSIDGRTPIFRSQTDDFHEPLP